MMTLWYDADTLLEEVLDTMPADIQALFDNPAYVTDVDVDESWKARDLNAMDEWDEFGRAEALANDAPVPQWVRRTREANR
jgi:hypothetical protein